MSKSLQKNHTLYELIAPWILTVFREEYDRFGRIGFSRCVLAKDGSYLDLMVTSEFEQKEFLLEIRSELQPRVQQFLANSKILSRMPKLRFKADTAAGQARGIEDIMAEIRAKHDLS